jgi:hypothetical protein
VGAPASWLQLLGALPTSLKMAQTPLERIRSEGTDKMLADADDAFDLFHRSERGR